MTTEEPQDVSTVIEQVTDEHSKPTDGQNEERNGYGADSDSAESEDENVVLFDTTHSQNTQPDILQTYAF